LKIRPALEASYGAPVRAHETFRPVSVTRAKSGELIYDFGQNFAGVVKIRVKGKKGQKITVRHAEILTSEGELHTAFLRSAKCRLVYISRDGEQEYSPRMTYMGFRYAGVTGVSEENIELSATALYSEIPETGAFECSDERINRLTKKYRMEREIQFRGYSHGLSPARRAHGLDGRHRGICADGVL